MGKLLFNLTFIILTQTFLSIRTSPLNISNYSYPNPNDPSVYYVAVLSVNDIHGVYFPSTTTYLDKNNTTSYYESGGLDYLGKYISIMKREWGERFIFLDAGDQFQGGLETKISNGDIITDFYNIMNLTAATFGNHEWDEGYEYLDTRLHKSTFPYLACNIMNSTSNQTEFLYNQLHYKIITIDKIKIGIIGLANNVVKETSNGKFKDVTFLNYVQRLTQMANEIRPQVNAIIALGHVALSCETEDSNSNIFELKVYNKATLQTKCDLNKEVAKLLKELPPNTIDAFITGHSHDVTHHWVYDVPVMSGKNFGLYTNIMYLPFDKETLSLINNDIQIEGPLPTCAKVFTSNHRCDSMTQPQIDLSGELEEYTFHDVLITKEESLLIHSEYWNDKYTKFKQDNVTSIDLPLEMNKHHENALGNLYMDIYRRVTGADVAITNAGSFKMKWNVGNISVADVYSMNPYDNCIICFEVNGKSLRRMLFEVQSGKLAFYPTSGVKQVVKVSPKKKLISVKLFDGVYEKEIDDMKMYKVTMVDFLYPHGGDDFNKVVKWLKVEGEITWYRIEREEVLDYLRNVDKIEVEKLIDEYNPRLRIIP